MAETGGAGGRAYTGATAGAGTGASISNAVSGSAVGGTLNLQQTAIGGAGGYGSTAGGTGAAASSSLIQADSTATQFNGYSNVTGGAGGGTTSGAGGAGGTATSLLSLTSVAGVAAQSARATGGGGGLSRAAGNGGAGGSATASSTGVSSTTANASVNGWAYVTGGTGGNAYGGSGGAGGTVTSASGTATEALAVGGTAYGYAKGTSGAGGRGSGTGNAGGNAGTVGAVTASAVGFNAHSGTVVAGGTGGYGSSGAAGGAGGTVSLTNSVSGSTTGGTLLLTQRALAGAGGGTYGGAAGAAGNATASLTAADSTASSFTVTDQAYGGAGGTASSPSGGVLAGAAGGTASATVGITGAKTLNVNALRAVGGAGGSAGATGGTGTTGQGGNATVSGAATTTSSSTDSVSLRGYATGGAGGNNNTGTGTISGGAGGVASGSAASTQTAATGSRAYTYLGLTGGAGGVGRGAGQSGGAGGAVSLGTVSASGFGANTVVHARGGTGGRGYAGANGGAGQSVTLLNAATTTAASNGYVRQAQGAYGGTGGYSASGTAAAGGAASSTLSLANAVNGSVNGAVNATGGGGGGGGSSAAGAAGGQGAAALTVGGARYVGAQSATATGGAGGNSSGAAGGRGGNATATASATSTTQFTDGVRATSRATGGSGGTGATAGGQAGWATLSSATATEAGATGGRADARAYSTGGTGGTSQGTGQAGGAGGFGGGVSALASGHSVFVYAGQAGGAGGSSSSGAGGAGAASTLTDAVKAVTTDGYERLRQFATGGNSGTGQTVNGIAGGAATSSLTFNDNTYSPIHASSTGIYSYASGGRGGSTSGAGISGAGGAATASVAFTGTYTQTVHAGATGGAGAYGSVRGIGGNAIATATGISTALTNAGNPASTVTAIATGGTGSSQGTAQATATAQTSSGQNADAAANASGSADTLAATATALTSGVVTSAVAATSATGAGTMSANSLATANGTGLGLLTTQYSVYAQISSLPGGGTLSSITNPSAINALLGSGNTAAVLFGSGVMGGYNSVAGAVSLTSTDTFTVDGTHLAGNLILGLSSAQSLGNGFVSLSLTTTVNGATVAAATQTFTTLAAANAFFTNNAIILGSVANHTGDVVQVSDTLTTSSAGDGYSALFVVGAAGGNGPPVFTVPAAQRVGQGVVTAIGGVSLAESGVLTNDVFTVTLADTNGQLAVIANGGTATISATAHGVQIVGSLASVNSALASLKITDATTGADAITLNATDTLGGTATQASIAVSVNGTPTITAPTLVNTVAGRITPIAGIALAETGNTIGESFTATLSDTNGLLSATSALGTSISGTGTTRLTISGSIQQVNDALAHLSDTDAVSPSDTIAVTATDSLGGVATPASITVAVTSAPVITAPATAVTGVNQADVIAGLSLSENGALTTTTFTETLSDAIGLLSASGAGGATVAGGGTTALSISGTLAQVNAALLTVTDQIATTAGDTITLNATDQFATAAIAATVAVSVNALPVLSAPASAIVGQNTATAVSGFGLNETGNTTNETFTVTLSDARGLISVLANFGGTITGSGGTSVTVSGTLGQVSNDLSTVSITEATTAADTLSMTGIDSLGNTATPLSVSLTVNGPPVIAAPAAATVGISKPTTIAGVSLSETGNTTSMSFYAILTDATGVLSIANDPLGAGVIALTATSIEVYGSLAQVNAALANLTDTSASLSADTITISAHDSINTQATGRSIAVTIVNGPVISVPAAKIAGVNHTASIAGISIAESGAQSTDPFTVALTDGTGHLAATISGAAQLTGQNTTALTISGTLADVNATLASLVDTSTFTGADTINVNASDQFGFTAGAQTVGVTVLGAPVISAPSTQTVGVGTAHPISFISVSEPFANGSNVVSVTLGAGHGLLTVGTAFGATLGGNGTGALTVSGTQNQVNNALSTLSDVESTSSPDSIVVNATDIFGNVASQVSVAVTSNQVPVITVPGAVAGGAGKVIAIPGISVSEVGDTTSESFTVTLTDTTGHLSVTPNVNVGITGQASTGLTVSGSLAQVNLVLATLVDTNATVSNDTIIVAATDSLGNAATSKSVLTVITAAPVITAPATATFGVARSGPLGTVSLAELNATGSETFTITLADTHGLFTVGTPGTASVTGAGTATLSVGGTLSVVNAALLTLGYVNGTTPSDAITINAIDQFGVTAGQRTIAATINAPPAFSAPTGIVLGVGTSSISSIGVSETGNTTNETISVIVADTHGLLSVSAVGGGTFSGQGSTALTIGGTFSQVSAALATLTDAAPVGTDTITLNATDGFGNAASTSTVGVTVNGLPVIAAPASVALGIGRQGPVAGISLSETGVTAGETFFVTLNDALGVLSASNAGGASVGAAGARITVAGTLAQVNAALATLTDTASVTPSESIAITATDGFGNAAAPATVTVNVANGPTLTAANGVTVGVNQTNLLPAFVVAETGATVGETFTATLTDTNGLLSASVAGTDRVTGSNTTSLTVTGTLADVNATLSNVLDHSSSLTADSIAFNATDSFGNVAGTRTTAVTVNGVPVILAPASEIIGVTQTASIPGVGVTETGNTTGPLFNATGVLNAVAIRVLSESLTVTLSDATGLLSASIASGAAVSGGGSTAMTIGGTFAQVDAALATLTVVEGLGVSSDTVVLNAADSFGNVAIQQSVALTVNGLPTFTAPAAVTVGIAKPFSIAGVSLAETGVTSGESFTVTLTDSAGVLSASNAGGAGVTAAGASLTIIGSLTQVNAALATLSDTDGVLGTGPDTIVLNATDTLGNHASITNISVFVANGPVIAAPATAVIGVNQSLALTGISVSESGSTATESFVVTVQDSHGLLSTGNAGGAAVAGSGTAGVTFTGTLAQVNTALANLHIADATPGAESLTVNATDGFGNTAGTQTVLLTINGTPSFSVPSTLVLGVGKPGSFGVSLGETGNTAGEVFTVTVADTAGALSTSNAGGAGVVGGSTASMRLTGTLAQIDTALASLSDISATPGTDTITLNATDSFGNAATQASIAVTVNARPLLVAPPPAVVALSVPTGISGITLAEAGNTAGESFSVTLSDAAGLLSVSGAGGAGVTGGGTTSLTVHGSLAQVDAALATLTDTTASTAPDLIVLNAVDSFGNASAQATIAVSVQAGLLISAPASAVFGVTQPHGIAGVSLAESGAVPTQTFTASLSDTNGLLSVGGGATVTGNGTSHLTVSGTLSVVNAALATLSDTSPSAGSDQILIAASDQFSNTATPATVAVTVNGLPVVTAPASASVGQNVATAIGGVQVTELGNTTTSGETFTATLSDTNGVLAATTGASGGGGTITSSNGGTTLSISGTLAQLNADLSTLRLTDASTASDVIAIGVLDSFGNSASTATGITVTAQTGPLSIAAPGSVVSGVGHIAAVAGVSLSESPTTGGEVFTAVVADTNGVLSANIGAVGGGGTIVPSNVGHGLTITGTLAQVNADLSTLGVLNTVPGSDTITVAATDSNGGAAGPSSIGVTINGLPVITAPSTATVNQSVATTVSGISLSETGNTTTSGETFTVTLSDTRGVLAANTGAVGGGGTITSGSGGLTLTLAGTLAQVAADLSTLSDTEFGLNGDTITLTATDSFGNSAASSSTLLSVAPAVPTITAGNTVFWNQGATPTVIDPALLVTDAGSTTLSGAVASFGAGFLTGDALVVGTPGGLASSYNAATGVLTLTGTASVATYQTALESITYASGSSNPTAGGTDSQRVIDWQASNGSATSALATSTINVGGIFNLTTGADVIAAGPGNDSFIATTGTLSTGDQLSGGGGTNTLTLSGPGTFDLRAPASFGGIPTIFAQEGQPSAVSGGHVIASQTQVLYLRNGTTETVNVTPATINALNPKTPGITIIGANNADTIHLGTGNDAVTVGGTNETIIGGSGNDIASVTAQTIGATITGGPGTMELLVGGGGLVTMGSNLTGISSAVLAPSGAAYDFIANTQVGLLVRDNSTGADTLQAGGLGQTLTGGAAGQVTMIGASSTTFQNSAATFKNDVIEGFNSSDTIRIVGLAFNPATTSSLYVANQNNTGGTLSVSVGGVVQTSVLLTGSFAPLQFTRSGGADTLIRYGQLLN